MFETISHGFRSARNFLQGQALLTESNIAKALEEVRVALLNADVHWEVVDRFLNRIKEKSLGKEVQVAFQKQKISPAQHFIKICQDELENLMGSESEQFFLSRPIASIMLVGLQGSGKTTTAAKLAQFFKKKSYQPLLVAADVYRPAAIRQLEILCEELQLPVFSDPFLKPPELCKMAYQKASEQNCNLLIFDTAGRLAIDEVLMQELENIKQQSKPDQIWLVIDGMMGQNSVETATEFNRRLNLDGFILTKLDGDARGGAALSIREITQKPIRFIGVGEKLAHIEEFKPKGLASRILGMGDIASLVQDFEAHIDQAKAEKDAQKMLKGQLNLQDFLDQIRTLRKIGPIAGLLEKLPGIGSMMPAISSQGEGQITKIESMILSMTPKERKKPDLILQHKTRRRRIALGSGHQEHDVDQLLKQFSMMKNMMQNLGQAGYGLPKPSSFSMPRPMLSSTHRKEKRKREKLARKKNKKK